MSIEIDQIDYQGQASYCIKTSNFTANYHIVGCGFAGLDLSSTVAVDLLQIMGSFGVSNYITGPMLILLGWKIRPLALAMLGVIPVAYLVGAMGIKINTTAYAATEGDWGGLPMMMAYMGICVVTFIASILMTQMCKKKILGS